MTEASPDTPPDAVPPVVADLDRVNLEQALRDVETANARVIDLTRRLVELSAENDNLRAQLNSRAYKVARRVADLAKPLRS